MAIERIVDLDPIAKLYDELKIILTDIEIKFSVKADTCETFEIARTANEYLDAYEKKDSYELYVFSDQEYIAVGVGDRSHIDAYKESPFLAPKTVRDALLKNRREKIISSYSEQNDYYRELAGLPPLTSVGAVIVSAQADKSLVVVPDSDPYTFRDPNSRKITESSAYNIMNTTLFEPGDHILISTAVIQDEKTSVRSFEIVADTETIGKSRRGVYVRDVRSIMASLDIDIPVNTPLVGKFLFIPITQAIDVSHFFTKGYVVVPDEEEDYDRTTMIKFSEAKLNNPRCVIGDRIVFKDYRYVTTYYEDTYGISTKVPVHEIRDYYGKGFITILESTGFIKDLMEKYPEDKYLKYIGAKRVPIHISRRARNFDILYLPKTERDVIPWVFSTVYNGARDYFVNTVYNFHYREVYEYYDNFIGIAIMQMAISQTIAKAMQTAIDRDFYDETLMIWLFNMYDVPYCTNLPYQTQRRLAKNLNMLIQRKGSNQVVYDIASILGYHDFTIYKYYLMKERLFDSDGNLVYKDTLDVKLHMNENGELIEGPVIVNDVEKMYDVYLQKVDLKETNFQNALTKTSNRVDYYDVTQNDPLWWDDADTFNEVYGDNTKFDASNEASTYHRHYNFMETKYLGITISYKLSEVLYENIILLRLIFDKKDELTIKGAPIELTLPKITGTMEISLFDCIVFLAALISKQYHLTGEILTRYSSILDVMGYINEDVDGYKPMDSLVFNFEKLTNTETFKELMKNPRKYLTEEEEKVFDGYFSVLTLDQAETKDKINALNEMFQNIKGLGYFIGRKISEASDINEYRAWRDLYNSIFIGEENREMFMLGTTGMPAKTYLEYLSIMNPALYSVVDGAEDNELYTVIDHTISRLEKVISDIGTLYTLNDSNSSLINYLIKLLKFFKSYTVDLLDVTTQYIFDAKPDNVFKLAEWYAIHQVIIPKDAFKLMHSDVIRMIETRVECDPFKMTEYLSLMRGEYLIRDTHAIGNTNQIECNNNSCKSFCKNNKSTCAGAYRIGSANYTCRHYGYDLNGFKKYIDRYTELMSNMISEYSCTYANVDLALRNHILWSYRAYILSKGYNVYYDNDPNFDKDVLKERLRVSLVMLNTRLSDIHAGLIVSNVGVDGISEWLDLLSVRGSNIPIGCQNHKYPCREEKCVDLLKYDMVILDDTVYANDYHRYREWYEKILIQISRDSKLFDHDTALVSATDEQFAKDTPDVLHYEDKKTSYFMTARLSELDKTLFDTIETEDVIYADDHDGIRYRESLIFIEEEDSSIKITPENNYSNTIWKK